MENEPGIIGDIPPRSTIPTRLIGTVLVIALILVLVAPQLSSFLEVRHGHMLLDTISEDFTVNPDQSITVQIDMDIGDVIVETSSSSDISYSLNIFGTNRMDLNEADEVEYSLNLIVFNQEHRGFRNDFSYHLVISVPESINELELFLENGIGDIDLNLETYSGIVNVLVQASVGEVTGNFLSTTLDEFEIDSSTGDIDIKLDHVNLSNDILLSTSTGSIRLETTNLLLSEEQSIDLQTSTGDAFLIMEQEQLTHNIHITAGMSTGSFFGSIIRSQGVGTNFDLDSSIGSISAPNENFVTPFLNFEVSVSTGDIEINEEII